MSVRQMGVEIFSGETDLHQQNFESLQTFVPDHASFRNTPAMTAENHLSVPAHCKALKLVISIYKFPGLQFQDSTEAVKTPLSYADFARF